MQDKEIDEKMLEQLIKDCGLNGSPFPDCHALVLKDGTVVRLEGEVLRKFLERDIFSGE